MEDNKIEVGSFTLGMVGTNCYYVYRVGNTNSDGKIPVIFFDPADNGGRLYEELTQKGFVVELILLTHGHFDHIGGAQELRDLTGCKIGCYEKEMALCNDIYLNVANDYGMNVKLTPDILYKDGEVIEAAGLSCKLMATPGHTSGSCCYYFEEGHILMSGDTLFNESVGRTDFPTGSTSEIIRSINDVLFTLPDDTVVYPGHEDITTIEHEKRFNPYANHLY